MAWRTAFLTLPDCRGSCNLGKISWIICTFTFHTTNIFGCFLCVIAQFEHESISSQLHIHLCSFQITHGHALHVNTPIATIRESSQDMAINMLNCDVIVIKFKIQFTSRLIPLENYKPTYPSAMSKIVLLLFFNKDGFGIKWPSKIDVLLNKEIKWYYQPQQLLSLVWSATSYIIYTLKTHRYENIAKLLIHPSFCFVFHILSSFSFVDFVWQQPISWIQYGQIKSGNRATRSTYQFLYLVGVAHDCSSYMHFSLDDHVHPYFPQVTLSLPSSAIDIKAFKEFHNSIFLSLLPNKNPTQIFNLWIFINASVDWIFETLLPIKPYLQKTNNQSACVCQCTF